MPIPGAGSNVASKISEGVPSIAGSDFITLTEDKKQSFGMIYGDAGCGKTTFCTDYTPGPLAFINFDGRARKAVLLAQKKGRKIHYCKVDFPGNLANMDDKQARAAGKSAVAKMMRNLDVALRLAERGDVRTIAIDTGTEYSGILNIAYTGSIERAGNDFGKSVDYINRQWLDIFNSVRQTDAHLVILARAKAIYQGHDATGEFAFRGPSVMNDGVDWAAHLRHKKQIGKIITGRKRFEMKVAKAGVNLPELGAVYSEDDWEDLDIGPFAYMCLMMHGWQPRV